jgi:DNA-binding transcriptional LysR family regulator
VLHPGSFIVAAPQLPHLATFCQAAERSSFTAAARALGLTQAAVSQRIAALEKELGKPLFQRRGGRVILTDAGHTLYRFAQRVFDLEAEVRRAIAGREEPVRGELLLGASSVPGEHLLPALLSEFRRRQPHIQARATVGDSLSVLEQLERGQVHLGLVGRKTDNPHLEFRFLAKDHLALVAPPKHPLCRRKHVSLKDLRGHALVVREAGSGSRHCLEQSLAAAAMTLADLPVALELGSNEAIKESVLRGAGVAILSTSAVQKELKARTLRTVEVSDLECDRDIYLVHDRRRVLPPPARQFLIFLETQRPEGV